MLYHFIILLTLRIYNIDYEEESITRIIDLTCHGKVFRMPLESTNPNN